MILGQTAELDEGPNAGEIAAGTIESLVGGIATSIGRLVNRGEGGDVEAAAEAGIPAIPEVPDDATGVVGAGKAAARKPSATAGEDSGYYSMGETAKSVWPWLLGIGLLGGGAWWYIKRRKRSKKGK